MRRRLGLVALVMAMVVLAACSSGKKAATRPPTTLSFPATTTTTAPATAVTVSVLSPEKGSVQGLGGRGLVLDLVVVAKDATKLPAEFRLGGALPAPAAAVKPGHNPAFPGLVAVLTTTGAALGGPSTNLANLFQIVSPSVQADGTMRVSVVWTNAQASFGSDVDVTLVALIVSGTAPDTLPQNPSELSLISNVAQVTFHMAGGEVPASAVTSSTTPGSTTTTKPGATTTTTKPGATTTTTKATATTTTAPATTVAPTTSTTMCRVPPLLC